MKKIFKHKKIFKSLNKTKILTVVLLVVFVFSSLLTPKPAYAQLDALSAAMQTVLNVFKIPYDVTHWLYEKANAVYEKMGAIGFRQALKNITHNIAVDTATYLATGDKGQAPLYNTSFKDYIQKEADAFLGDALNNRLKEMWGVNLCEPLDPLFKVKFEITTKNYFRQQRPACTFTKMWKNVKDARKLKLVDLPKFADIFNPNSNELGMLVNVTAQLQDEQKKKIDLAKLNLSINRGWKAVTSKVTGEILTPPDFIKKMSVDLPIDVSWGETQLFTGELAADFIGPFANTLTSKFLERIKKGLFDKSDNMGSGLSNVYGGNLTTKSPLQAAKERFADLGRPNYNFGGPFDLLSKLSCQNNNQGQYGCVIDEGLNAALLEAPHLTVKQALEKGLLHADWPFGYRADKSGGIDPASKNIYSYRNLVILRKYRIIPVGWELAAQYYALYDKSGKALTLQRLIDNYDNSNSPYYRLVDPNWVLKAPETICEREGPGELASEEVIQIPSDKNNDGKITADEYTQLPIRLNYCADERTCIKEKADGSGCLYYGYCTEEKPIWRIHSDHGACQPLFNSCRAYSKRNGEQVGYLSNTLWGKDICNLANVGCRKYSQVWDSETGEWSSEDADVIYLNKNAGDNECAAQEEGCSRFIRLSEAVFQDDAEGNQVSYEAALANLQGGADPAAVINYDFSPIINLKKAPAYLGCEGYTQVIGSDKDSCSGYWREDINKCVASGSQACEDYILSCSADEAGCQFYMPQSYQGPEIPGVVSENDYCPQECVGYKTYMEQPSFLDRQSRTVNFIARTAQTCSAADNGCEEFTNLSEGIEGEQVEYYSTIRSCILPDNPNVGTYYSWASTDEAGNQLKSWQLLKSNIGDYPCTNSLTQADGTVVCTDDQNSPWECTFGNTDPEFNPIYNPDCVEFVGQDGASHWMRYSRVIFTSEGCVPMRRTKTSEVYSIDPAHSQACSAQAVGCREYKGSTANNIKVILNDDFEDGTDQDWDGGTFSNESLIANGHSLLVKETNSAINKELNNLIHQGRSYKLSFWAKGAGNTTQIRRVYFKSTDNQVTDFTLSADGLNLGSEWNRYEVNLNNLDRSVTESEVLNIEGADGRGFYIDNIILTETQDDLYLIQDSWQTPASCTQVVDGRNMLGCEAYKDQQGQDWYLRSFDHLCRDELVGCEAMIDTYNSLDPEMAQYNQSNSDASDDVTVPADSLVYLVYDQNKLCNQVGCQALGLFEYQRDGSIQITTKYLINDANKYGTEQNPLCQYNEEGCEEFKLKDGGVEYFFDPTVFTCEYKQVKGNYGWYESGTEILCPVLTDGSTQGHCLGGRDKSGSLDNLCSQASDCTDYARAADIGSCSQWVGLCPIEQNNCTEYQDPSNPPDCNKQAVYGMDDACDYYYYQSDKVEICTEDELGKGCQAFHQTGGGNNIYYSTPRCTGDIQRKCETDSDCVDSSGQSLGRCSYLAPSQPPQAGENSVYETPMGGPSRQ